jgi:hypothetical protein
MPGGFSKKTKKKEAKEIDIKGFIFCSSRGMGDSPSHLP